MHQFWTDTQGTPFRQAAPEVYILDAKLTICCLLLIAWRTLNYNITCTLKVTIAPHLWEHPTQSSSHGKYYQEVDNQADNQEGECLRRVLAQSQS